MPKNVAATAAMVGRRTHADPEAAVPDQAALAAT